MFRFDTLSLLLEVINEFYILLFSWVCMALKNYKEGDFTGIGNFYRRYRKGYSEEILSLLINHVGAKPKSNFKFVDVGAGTGIWTRQIAERGFENITAVEPNDDMRENGIKHCENFEVDFVNGSGEDIPLDDNSVNFVSMASSFHWTNPEVSLPEFHRILKSGGHLCLIWNPLLKKGDKLQEEIENLILSIVPEFKRGSRANDNFEEIMKSTGHFDNVLELRKTEYKNILVKDYIETWRAVNQLQAVAGEERFEKVMSEIENYLDGKEYIDVPYLNKCWIGRRVD